ncbi:alcohol dehydrogenase [Colletotrichum tabaci]|uniref:Alcohol dehydrogenase n=1 Tax=Colletotrichum tabaci TaxID=1209068 RepID=A0AAV9TKY3_9PEZI
MARQWILARQEGFEASLEFKENVSVPATNELGRNKVLVKIKAASLNFRDLSIPKGAHGPINIPLIPGCDGAGVVEAVGLDVEEFVPGDRVVMYSAPELAETRGDDAQATLADTPSMLGHGSPGTLTTIGVFSEKALVHAPKSLDWLPAGSLSCNWPTAWNALYGLKDREAGPGKWVLVQGTGGLSVAILQVAVAAGATVVATTSTEDKAARLCELGASRTVNYRTSADTWGTEARALTPEGRGFDIVIDVGGDETLGQSLKATRPEGVLYVLGRVGGDAEPVSLFGCLMATCMVRGILYGSRNQFKEVVKFIDEKGIVPAGDDVVFELADAKNAYKRLNEKKHFAKVLIKIE